MNERIYGVFYGTDFRKAITILNKESTFLGDDSKDTFFSNQGKKGLNHYAVQKKKQK